MVAFAGWHLPVQFSGVIDEHVAVRTRVGLFDVSHMGEASVRGRDALDYLQGVTCNDVARLRPGRAQYSALTTPQGTFVDDLLVYRLEDEEFLLVINAANTTKDVDWLTSHAVGRDVIVEDASPRWAQVAVQGPHALDTLQPLVASSLAQLKYFRFMRVDVVGAPCIVSRTGYTGEDGFEIYAPVETAEALWEALLASGAPHGVARIGLAARDTLRLEAKLALYGNDIDETTTVIEADLGWIVKPNKGEFLGREVLVRQLEHGVERKLTGFEMSDRAIARHGYAALHDGHPVGRVTSGTHSPTLRKNIGLAYLPVDLAAHGTEIHIEIRGRPSPAVVVPTPFYRRPKMRG
jgi:aminomethyltransferase